ncbi:MAG TPA: glycoside hydrolase family 31 protein [Herpetosiphonaceae bacterium]
MQFELSSSAGRIVIEENCRIRFERQAQTILQSGQFPVFGLAYGVELSVTSIVSTEQREDGLLLALGTTVPHIRLTLEVEQTDTGFRLLLIGPESLPALGFNWLLDPGGPWYGQGERVIQTWPLDRQQVISEPLMPYDHAADGTLNITTPLWLNASGAAILAEEGAGELQATLGRSDDGLLRIVARAPELPFGLGFDAPLVMQGPRLALDVLLADSLPRAFMLALRFLGYPTSAPPEELFARPIWTTWAQYKMAITQEDVLRFAEAIVAQDYPRSVLEIDDRWQAGYGACIFDPAKFPDPKAMVEQLHAQGFKVTLWMPPFFDPQSPAFAEAADRGFLVRHPATGAPYLVRWWQGYGGLLDVSNQAALDWWLLNLRRLQTEYGVDGFKFDAGEGNFLPSDAVTAQPLSRHQYADRYVQWVAQHFEWTEVRTGWRAQRHGIFFREWDKWSRWGVDNGLHSVLTQALALSVIGYPFILPDMIGGNAYNDELPDRELMIRWTQLTALLPAMQFSIPPWRYDAEAAAICRRYAVLHGELAPYIHSLVGHTLRDGTPIVRPLFWHAPQDQTALRLDDQFLLGDLLLVAPILHPGQDARNIYLPEGRWRDRWNGAVFDGPLWLNGYAAPLETLPLFERLSP